MADPRWAEMTMPLRAICDGTRQMTVEHRAGFDGPCNDWLVRDVPKDMAIEHHGPELPSNPRTLTPATPPAPLLGDAISSALSAIGITEERVSAWLGKPCGCGARKKKLNDLHAWFAGDRSAAPVVE